MSRFSACVGADDSEGDPVLHPLVLLPLVLLGLVQVGELVDFDLARQDLLHDLGPSGAVVRTEQTIGSDICPGASR